MFRGRRGTAFWAVSPATRNLAISLSTAELPTNHSLAIVQVAFCDAVHPMPVINDSPIKSTFDSFRTLFCRDGELIRPDGGNGE